MKKRNHAQKTGFPFYLILMLPALLTGGPLFADSYHNINGFFGERAAGLAGAFTAISDDPSGAYYNPAGLAFAYDNYISISASNYREIKKNYENVFGAGQSYQRTSRNFLPNYFGAVKNMDKLKFAFSIVNPVTESFDQADQINLPQTSPDLFSYRNDYQEENVTILVGPSVAFSVNERLALGATLYYTYDTSRTTTTQLVTFMNGAYFQTNIRDRRRTMGLLPILGLQFMPSRDLSLGTSIRHQFVTSVNRNQSLSRTSSAASRHSMVRMVESTDHISALTQGSAVITGPPETGSIPRTTELRLGVARFLSRYLLVTGDIIHTTGFRADQDNTQVDLHNNIVYLNDPEIQALSREPVTNIAMGLEYYLTDNLSLRFGYFTNKANSRKVDWLEAAGGALARAAGTDRFSTLALNGILVYNIPGLTSPVRFEHVDNTGFSLGFGWETSNSTISLTYVTERGRGQSQIDSGQLSQPLVYDSFTVYIVASTRQ